MRWHRPKEPSTWDRLLQVLPYVPLAAAVLAARLSGNVALYIAAPFMVFFLPSSRRGKGGDAGPDGLEEDWQGIEYRRRRRLRRAIERLRPRKRT